MLFQRTKSQSPIANVIGHDPPLSLRLLALLLVFACFCLFWQSSYDSLMQAGNEIGGSKGAGLRYMARLYSSPVLVWEGISTIVTEKVLDGYFADHLWASSRRVLIGLVIGTGIGFLLGPALVVASAYTRFVGLALIFILMGISKISVTYLMLLWFDTIEAPKVAIGVWATMLYQLALSYEGAYSCVYGRDPYYRQLMSGLSMFRPSKWFLYWRIVLPAIRERLFLALLLVNPVCWLMLIIAEEKGPRIGLGAIIAISYNDVHAQQIMAGTVLLAFCIFISLAMIWTLRRICLR